MIIKKQFLSAVLLALLYTGAANAGEGSRDSPFDNFQAPGSVTIIHQGDKRLPSKGQDPFPFANTPRVVILSDPDPVLPSNGSQGGVETANSLPRNFANGTPAFEQRKTVLAFLRQDAVRQEMAAQRSATLMAQNR